MIVFIFELLWWADFIIVGLAVITAAISFLLVPLAIRSTFQQSTHPHLDPLDDEAPLPSEVSQHFTSCRNKLAHLGFELVAAFSIPQQVENALAFVQLYVNRTTSDTALVTSIFVNPAAWEVGTEYVEFQAEFADGSAVNTGNPSSVGAFPVPDNKLVVHCPWIRSIHELFQIHGALIESRDTRAARILRLDESFNGDAKAYLIAGIRKELADAAAAGFLKLTSDEQHYNATLWGAYMITFVQMPPFDYLVKTWNLFQTRQLLRSVLDHSTLVGGQTEFKWKSCR